MARTSFRQGIVRHTEPNFLQLSGQAVTLIATITSRVDFTLAQGMKNYLYSEHQTIIDAWVGPFTSGKNYWLYWDIDLASGVRTFGHTLCAPIAQSIPPPENQLIADLHWFDTTANKMKVYNGNSFVEKLRVFAAKLINGVTFQSLSIRAPDFTGTQVGLEIPSLAGAFVFDSVGQPIRTGDGAFFTTEDSFVTGVPTGASLKINSTLVPAAANQPLTKFQVVQFVAFNKIGPASPSLTNDVILGMIDRDLAATEVTNVQIQGLLFNEEWDFTSAGVNASVFVGVGGIVSLTPIFPTQFPIGRVIDKQTILFSPTLFS